MSLFRVTRTNPKKTEVGYVYRLTLLFRYYPQYGTFWQVKIYGGGISFKYNYSSFFMGFSSPEKVFTFKLDDII